MLESAYQTIFFKKVRKLFPGCLVQKLDSGYQQGIPDWLILYKDMWAVLEVKRKPPKSDKDFEPNQQWFLRDLNQYSFAACVFPENEQEVLDGLQQAFQSGRPARLPSRKLPPLGTIR